MKTKILLLFLLGWVGMAFGQEKEIKEGGNYYFNHISLNDLEGLNSESSLNKSYQINDIREAVSGKKYRVTINKINLKDELVYFTFWKFKDSIKNIVINNSLDKKDDNRVEYVMPLEDFKKGTKPLYNRVDWRVGVYTVPIKVRFSNFSFDPNANLGANLGAKIKWNRELDNSFALEPIVGFGLASIKLDESNSNITGSTDENAKKSTNVSAFTANLGVLVHIKNTINIGLTYGFDKISKNDHSNYGWKYNGKGWLGVGINVAFSNQNNTGEATSN